MYSLVFRPNILDGRQLLEVNRHFLRVSKERGFYHAGLVEEIVRAGTVAGVSEVPPDVRRVFVCARDIAPEWHIQMQAAFQRHCDSSIAKTINIPASATQEEVRDIFLLAYRAVLREMHASAAVGVRSQLLYQTFVEAGRLPRDQPSPLGMFAVERLMVAYETHLYQSAFDEAYLHSEFGVLEHDILTLDDVRPSVGAAGLFDRGRRTYG